MPLQDIVAVHRAVAAACAAGTQRIFAAGFISSRSDHPMLQAAAGAAAVQIHLGWLEQSAMPQSPGPERNAAYRRWCQAAARGAELTERLLAVDGLSIPPAWRPGSTDQVTIRQWGLCQCNPHLSGTFKES